MNNNNEFTYLKVRVDNDLFDAFKKLLIIKNISQQEFVERAINDFVVKNLKLLLVKIDKES